MPVSAIQISGNADLPGQHLLDQVELVHQLVLSREVGDALPIYCLVLSEDRKILYGNRKIRERLSITNPMRIFGMYPGEIFKCVNSLNPETPCGSSPICKNCGAFQSIIGALDGEATEKEYRLSVEGGIAEDFRVTATPISRDGQVFIILTLVDIHEEKRRQALERVFYHDILNTAGGVCGLVEVLNLVQKDSERDELISLLKESSLRLVEEIRSGRELNLAEEGELELQLTEHDLLELTRDSIRFYLSHPICLNREIHLAEDSQRIYLDTDSSLVHRIIGNLIKNALESTAEHGVVRVRVRKVDNQGIISVSNDEVMTQEVKEQVFQRSFSTKGPGRGIGTYSVKLFTEKYLGGEVWFESAKPEGTTFHVGFPLGPC